MKSEHLIQDEIREAVSRETDFLIFRCNAGNAYCGEKRYSVEFGQNVLVNLRPYKGLPKGFSDLLAIGPDGKAVFLEVKTDTGKLRPEQERFLKIMAALGHRTAVVRSAEEAVSFLKSLSEEENAEHLKEGTQ